MDVQSVYGHVWKNILGLGGYVQMDIKGLGGFLGMNIQIQMLMNI